jgi:transcription antitermination protein NusB
MNDVARRSSKAVSARRGARLAAVQALYQMEIANQSAPAVIADFNNDRLGLGPDGEPFGEPDSALFVAIIEGVVRQQSGIDSALTQVLAAGWKLERIDAIARAILRAGCYEIQDRLEIPAAGLIEAYVELAHQFLDEPAPGFIKGALDSVARTTRPGELGRKGA